MKTIERPRPGGRILPVLLAILACAAVTLPAAAPVRAAAAPSLSLTVSMERPSTHYYHVVFRAEGLAGDVQDFKMPVWTPGYYQIMDYAKNVKDFRAEDGAGRPLAWDKTAKNTWRVRTGRAAAVVVSYDVYAFNRFVAASYLADDGGFITPAGVFMHAAGLLGRPVTVSVRPAPGWTQVSTGLDPVAGRPGTFAAPDFDTLYDCPFLIGRQEILTFEAAGRPHTVAAYDLGSFDRARFTGDLARIVEAAAALMGDLPYRHYTFLVIGPGGGGLEHLNSTAVTLNPASLDDAGGYKRWLTFVAHEYFHLFNVKAIRPLTLGPFDYDRENYTDLLWFSEGVTVYYEHLLLNRAGLMARDEVLDRLGSTIAVYENAPGRAHQPARLSSLDAWNGYFGRSEHVSNTTISYYDIGCGLGLLLDLGIREASKGRASLDDVMRTLYRTYYRDKKRGFTAAELRQACERAAGAPLAEIFETCAETTEPWDYARYLAGAGLAIDLEPRPSARPWFGALTQDRNGSGVISAVEEGSPASRAGLSAQDEILALDGARLTPRPLQEILGRFKPGDKVRVLYSRRGRTAEAEIELGRKAEPSWRITLLADPTAAQKALLDAWLK
ncbi:MAG TPA: PDZ domain-containing protein [Candidatus Aminicenantes bacterium]|nr:PDZ domain-containing protein [Candidatus Aminicenantes bacterium]HRY66108.1 PDZ domain-containing protein [Candidatus Aminicenantes bacterium]HRZ73022.1 PDZ domain-containing protein [Candidatus Aminicenantes bacterium]